MRQKTILLMMAALVTATSLSAADDEWKTLFNGKDLEGWQSKQGGTPSAGWVVDDGCLHRKDKGDDIVSVTDYEDFELEFEWKISEKGNSGVKYRFKGKLGPEYQVLDDKGHDNGRNPFTSASAMYLIAKPNAEKELKPVGEFNKSKIVAKGNHIEHWLNGKKVIEIEVGSEEWNKKKNSSKFKNDQKYGTGAGKILLQDHGNLVWFKNIRIKNLN